MLPMGECRRCLRPPDSGDAVDAGDRGQEEMYVTLKDQDGNPIPPVTGIYLEPNPTVLAHPIGREPREYRGCTTFGCEWGFNGDERAMPSEWSHCPMCGGELADIRFTPANQAAEPGTPASWGNVPNLSVTPEAPE